MTLPDRHMIVHVGWIEEVRAQPEGYTLVHRHNYNSIDGTSGFIYYWQRQGVDSPVDGVVE